MSAIEITRIKPHARFGMCNGGWAYDAYPELETLDAGRAMEEDRDRSACQPQKLNPQG